MCASRTSRAALIAAALLGVAAPAVAAEQGAPLARLTQDYLYGLFRAKPHLATFLGDHRFDDKVVDLAPAALAAREKELVEQQKKLAAIDRKKLPLDERTDAAIMEDGIALELLYLREIRDWTWDPRLNDSFPYYDPREIVGERLGFIIHGDYAPEAERRKAVTAQLLALPRLLAQMRAHLKDTSREYWEQAVKDNKGRIETFESEVKEFTQKDPEAESARKAAVAALDEYQSFLEKDLSKRTKRDWRLGRALYAKKFPLALQTRLTPAQAIARAEASFSTARADLSQVSLRLWAKLFPNEKPPADQTQVINRVKDELSKNHPKADELVQSHARNLDKLRAFISEKDLLQLPPRESLIVAPMPLYKRGAAAAEYIAPGVLDKSRPDFKATYFVDPVDPTWPKERIDSYLRANNHYEVELTAAHEAYPGHHTQFFYERRDLNPLRATLWNGAMVEGWAVYGEGLLTRLGYGGADNDRYRFFDARGRMIVASNIILDIKLQSGDISEADAVKFMVERGFQEQAQAEKKLVRARLDSTQLAQYWIGLDEIERLEADYRKKVGAGFKQRAFDEALIGHGSIAVEHLRHYLLGE